MYNYKLCVCVYTVLVSRIGDVIIISACLLYVILRGSEEEVILYVLKLLTEIVLHWSNLYLKKT